MTESDKFAFLYYVQAHPKHEDSSFSSSVYDGRWMKIPLIKAWRGVFGDGLRDSKEAVEELRDKNYFVEDKKTISKPLGLQTVIPGWSLSDKAEKFVDEMISIDEIAVEIIKWRLLNHGVNDYGSTAILAKNIYRIWGE